MGCSRADAENHPALSQHNPTSTRAKERRGRMQPGTNRMNRHRAMRYGDLPTTRDPRVRLLPTKHRLAALPSQATREYQSDSSSKRPGCLVLFALPPENPPPSNSAVDRGSLHISPTFSPASSRGVADARGCKASRPRPAQTYFQYVEQADRAQRSRQGQMRRRSRSSVRRSG